tara:strand:- start:23 stop:250 length:228 start_codon:yes stop_codon:yes gene_type:complete
MKKMHAISGNKQFMTKRAIPLLKKYGIQKSRANLIGGKTLELRFLIDDDKLERIRTIRARYGKSRSLAAWCRMET